MSGSSLLEADVIRDLRDTAQQLRVDSVRCSAAASSGHPTSSMSAADLMAVLLARHLRYDFAAPAAPGNDHLIFSKGHASPLLYAMLRAAGAIGEQELLSYRKVGSRLEGHPTPRLPWVDVATGRSARAAHRGGGGHRREAPGPPALPGMGAVRRQRARRGLDLGGRRAGLLLPAGQPDAHR